MEPMTVNDLKILCELEIAKGNGDKVIMISNDDEGNGYHYLYYYFTPLDEIIDASKRIGPLLNDFYNFDEKVAKVEDTILLG